MPTEIWTANDLDDIRNNVVDGNVVGNYVQMADIDLAGWGHWTTIGEWPEFFEGTYDGNNKSITNLYQYARWESGVPTPDSGLFRTVGYGGEVRNLFLINVDLDFDKDNIDNVGGISGFSHGIIFNCGVTGVVTGRDSVGGLAGEASDGSIQQSFAFCNIVSDTEVSSGILVGGLVGYAPDATIKDCYSRGSVVTSSSAYSIGGFVGSINAGATIENCYSATHVPYIGTYGEDWHGGFIGHDEGGTIINCYYDSEVSGQSDTGKGEPRLTAEMVYPYTAKHVSGTYVGWGFEEAHITDLTAFDFVFGEPWKHDPAFTLNAGYPQFEPTVSPVDPTLTKIADCYTPTTPTLSISLDYGPFNNTVIERQDTMIAQYRFTNPPTGLTLKTKWRYLTPKLEHNVICGFECRGILIRYKLKGKKPKLIPEFE